MQEPLRICKYLRQHRIMQSAAKGDIIANGNGCRSNRQPSLFGLLRSRIQQSSAGWRYAGALSQHLNAQRNSAGVICASSRTADAARFDFEMRHNCGVHYKINRRPSQSKNNSARSQAQIKRREHEKSSVRAKVEHVFAVVKLQLRFRKTRYRGLQK